MMSFHEIIPSSAILFITSNPIELEINNTTETVINTCINIDSEGRIKRNPTQNR